jgi:hypothetical protein
MHPQLQIAKRESIGRTLAIGFELFLGDRFAVKA